MGLTDILGTEVLGKDGNVKVAAIECKNTIVCIYYSAHWCPPCRTFTPILAKNYKDWKANGIPIEVIFYSSDNSEAEYNSYYAEMPWLALPYDDRRLEGKFDVEVLPTLIVCNSHGELLNSQGLRDINFKGDNVLKAAKLWMKDARIKILEDSVALKKQSPDFKDWEYYTLGNENFSGVYRWQSEHDEDICNLLIASSKDHTALYYKGAFQGDMNYPALRGKAWFGKLKWYHTYDENLKSFKNYYTVEGDGIEIDYDNNGKQRPVFLQKIISNYIKDCILDRLPDENQMISFFGND